MKADVVIIGGGVIGAAIARELSRYRIDITLRKRRRCGNGNQQG